MVKRMLKAMGKMNRKSDKKWDNRFNQMSDMYVQKLGQHAAEMDAKYDKRLKDLRSELLGELDRRMQGVSSAASVAPSAVSAGPSGHALAHNINQPFVRSKVEVKGFIEDWRDKKATALTGDEAVNWVKLLLSYLDEESKSLVKAKESLKANDRVHVYTIVLHVEPASVYVIRDKVAQLLIDKPDLRVRSRILKCTTDSPPWMRPARTAVAKIMGALAKKGVDLADVRPDWEKPLTVWRQRPGGRPLGIVSWTAEQGFGILPGGLATVGLDDSDEARSSFLALLNDS